MYNKPALDRHIMNLDSTSWQRPESEKDVVFHRPSPLSAYFDQPLKNDRPALIWHLSDRGLGSEINVMLLAILYALSNDMQFALCSKNWNARWHKGWQDYFEPFCHEVCHPAVASAKHRRDISSTTLSEIGLGDHQVVLTWDVFDQIWNPAFTNQVFDLPQIGVSGDAYALCRLLMPMIWRLNRRSSEAVSQMQGTLLLSPDQYKSMHIRRGDKISEAKPVEIHKYMERIIASPEHHRVCHVMTDDSSVLEELRLHYRNMDFYSLCRGSMQGHEQAGYNAMTNPDRRCSTYLLLAELQLVMKSSHFVGTFSSNIGRLAALLCGVDRTSGVDGDYSIIY